MWANEAIDEVRKSAVREAKKDAGQGKTVQGGKKKNPANIAKYALLKNPENLTANQQATLEMLIKSDNRLHRAYLLKENLRLCFRYSYDEAVKELDKWLKWAQRCRIPEFVALGKKIKRHKVAILNSFKYRLTNARIEAINNNL
jgi:transposase